MPKKKSNTNTAKPNQIDAYTYPEYDRANNPPVGMAQYDVGDGSKAKYEYDPHIDPSLQWAGKKEGTSFAVSTSSIHIHESIKPHKIIRSVQARNDDDNELHSGLFDEQLGGFFESNMKRSKRRSDAIEFYQHKNKWTNRLIAGDSLVIMNSLLEKEGMAGQVQIVYIDPPYGIKYGSNFQPFVNKRDVKDKKDEDLSSEPEMIKAFRDTWELGIHSYLTYLRDRLLLARELLSETGSVFVQISDENVHHVRELCDEVFRCENFISMINFRTAMTKPTAGINNVFDYILWYSKNKDVYKFRPLYISKNDEDEVSYSQLQASTLQTKYEFEYNGTLYNPINGWRLTKDSLINLAKANRLYQAGKTKNNTGTLKYIRLPSDFQYFQLDNTWNQQSSEQNKSYVVQTAVKVIQRCLLMTTDPGDLVLDITCGSGTTAYVAEQWGRRWITCDTSRIAITLAKKRLMTATYDYYKLAHPDQGVSHGFVYKTVPHITLKSIANNEPPEQETLYDQPEIDKSKTRISGPFTVEALPAPVVKPLDDVAEMPEEITSKQADWRDELLATGILGRGGAKIEFSRVEPLAGTKFLQAEAETKENTPRRAVICFADETKPLDKRMVGYAMDDAETLRPTPKLIVFAAFQFDPEAAKYIDETQWPGVQLLKVQMNTDLMTDDLKKKRSSNQSFWLVGQPDVDLIQIEKGKDKGKYKVRVNGFDYYDVKKGNVESGNSSQIAMWMLDTHYDGMSIEPMQVFFPMGDEKDGWVKLAKTLKAEINQDLIKQYAGNESLPFTIEENSMIAVKIVDDRGIESLKIIKVGEN
jgi:adenine-specific DNA-methyltransferase